MTDGNGQGQPKGKEPIERVMDLFVHMPIGFAVMAWKRVPALVSAMPELVGQAVAKGCAQLAEAEERISEEVRKARMIGQVAVTFGGRQLRREVDARLRDARQAAEGVAGFRPGGGSNGDRAAAAPPVSTSVTPTAPASPPSPAKPGKAKGAAKPAATRKPATKATKAAGGRTATRASTAKASGATKRARRPAAPASAADLPIREYDGLSASQVVSRLTGLTPEELRAIRSYEEGSRGRRTVLVAIDRLLD
jgi:hypothetical protein